MLSWPAVILARHKMQLAWVKSTFASIKLISHYFKLFVNGQPSAINTTRLNRGGDAQRERTKSRVTSREGTTVVWHSKKLCFWINPKEVLNWLNSASWVGLEKSREKSREVQGFLTKIKRWKCKVLIKDSSRVKRGCGLVGRLKANEF